MSAPDHLLQELVGAQDEWAAVEAIPPGSADALREPARERRERAVRSALDGGLSLRTVCSATGLSAPEIARLREGDT